MYSGLSWFIAKCPWNDYGGGGGSPYTITMLTGFVDPTLEKESKGPETGRKAQGKRQSLGPLDHGAWTLYQRSIPCVDTNAN